MNATARPQAYVRQLLSAAALVLLTVVGSDVRAEISETVILCVNGADFTREFTRADLEEIGVVSFQTTTIWTEGVQEFTGTPLVEFVEAIGLHDGAFQAIAANDYAVEVPVSDAVEGGPIIAFLRNGEPMSLRDNGPLWLVYPYDGNPEYQSEIIYSRSIWQLERIEVVAP